MAADCGSLQGGDAPLERHKLVPTSTTGSSKPDLSALDVKVRSFTESPSKFFLKPLPKCVLWAFFPDSHVK